MNLAAWALTGLAWCALSLATALPFRRRHRLWVTVLRFSLGLPLVFGAWLEAGRSTLPRRPGRRSPPPYRGFAPLLWALTAAETVCLLAGLVARAVLGR